MIRRGIQDRTAKKPHRCAGCHTVINPGERYREYKNCTKQFGGYIYTTRYHHECVAAEIELNRDALANRDDPLQLWQHYEEQGDALFDKISPEAAARLRQGTQKEPDVR